jgi:hypothetical protein
MVTARRGTLEAPAARTTTPTLRGTSGTAFRSKAEWKRAFAQHDPLAHIRAHLSKSYKSLPARKRR